MDLSAKPYVILSFDGGGMRGVLQAQILSAIQDEIGEIPRSSIIAGTSTGALVAVGLASGMLPKEISDAYSLLGGKVFGPRNRVLWGLKRVVWPLLSRRPLYCNKKLKAAINEAYGRYWLQNRAFGKFSVPRLLCPSVNLVTQKLHVFDSWNSLDARIPIDDVLLAATAAPTFFSPHAISINNSLHYWIDGGLGCNNPALVAVLSAVSRGVLPTDIRVLSIGTGRALRGNHPKPFLKQHAIKWIKPVIETAMECSSEAMETSLELLSGMLGSYLRLNPVIPPMIPLDDFNKSTEMLPPIARTEVDRNRTAIKRLLCV